MGLTLTQQTPPESLLRAVYQLEWWQTFQQLADRFPIAKRDFWNGIKAQKQGKYQAALQAWSSNDLKVWRQQLEQGQQIFNQFSGITEKNAIPLYQQWSTWQQRHPGPKMWLDAPWYVQDYAGSDSYYSTERDLYGKAFRATQQRPVVIGIMGPATLSLQVRPLHAAYQDAVSTQTTPSLSQPDPVITSTPMLDGWIQIVDNKKAQTYPFFNNIPSQGLELSGAGNLLAGNLETLDYQVGSGWHEIRVFSEQAPLSLSVLEQRPEWALSILPWLQTDTFDGLTFMKDHSVAGAWQREKP
jgi:hypothetical protein